MGIPGVWRQAGDGRQAEDSWCKEVRWESIVWGGRLGISGVGRLDVDLWSEEAS
jgi:hypothetical protein